MIRRFLWILLAAPLLAIAQPKHEYIYGGELMTPQERERYRQDVGKARGADEQARVRERHRERMNQRARGRGARLNEQGVVEKPQ